jgi:hypothetical protein
LERGLEKKGNYNCGGRGDMNAREGCGNEKKGEGNFGEENKSGPYVPTVGTEHKHNHKHTVDGPKNQTN